MGTNIQDYVELLNAEQHVDMPKLKEHARHGIAARVRGEVWMYLLGVLSQHKTAEITSALSLNTAYTALSSNLPSHMTSMLLPAALAHHTHRFESPTYAGLISSITGISGSTGPTSAVTGATASTGGGNFIQREIGNLKTIQIPTTHSQTHTAAASPASSPEDTFDNLTLRPRSLLPPPPSAPLTRHAYLSMIESVLGKYYHTILNDSCADTLQQPHEIVKAWSGGWGGSEVDWIYLVTPFACCLSRNVAVYNGFRRMMDRMHALPPLPSRLATLLTLFRQALPELHEYFEQEQVPFWQVATCWLKTMLSREMWLGDVLRLWDSYLATDDMFALHCYVCVSILATCKETLEELDGSEAKLMLLDLPPMDVDRLLQDAANLRVAVPLPLPVEEDGDYHGLLESSIQ